MLVHQDIRSVDMPTRQRFVTSSHQTPANASVWDDTYALFRLACSASFQSAELQLVFSYRGNALYKKRHISRFDGSRHIIPI